MNKEIENLTYSNSILVSKVNELQEINNKLIKEKQQKVYVLTIDDVVEDWGVVETLVFKTLEKAKERMEQLIHNFITDRNIDEEESIIEYEEMSWTWYYDGEYHHNHYSLHIEEKEIL